MCVPECCTCANKSRVSDSNGVSRLYIIAEIQIYHSGRKPSKCIRIYGLGNFMLIYVTELLELCQNAFKK